MVGLRVTEGFCPHIKWTNESVQGETCRRSSAVNKGWSLEYYHRIQLCTLPLSNVWQAHIKDSCAPPANKPGFFTLQTFPFTWKDLLKLLVLSAGMVFFIFISSSKPAPAGGQDLQTFEEITGLQWTHWQLLTIWTIIMMNCISEFAYASLTGFRSKNSEKKYRKAISCLFPSFSLV